MKISDLGLLDYQSSFNAMKAFTLQRDSLTEDELWLLELQPVFTQGINGSDAHVFDTGNIPVIKTDRGGQVTYHGPGQLIAYPLVDLKRLHIGIREMISRLENSVIEFLKRYDIESETYPDAPGVYVDRKKIASLGLRVRRGACYHGLSINIDMDLTPFSCIDPCGYRGMEMVDLKTLGVEISMAQARQTFISAFEMQMR